MGEWVLIALFYSGYSGGMHSMTTTSLRFKSQMSCMQAASRLELALKERDKNNNGFINGMMVCVQDAK